ncbi:MAG TPA: porin family protein [Verrucomicrobiae bacterium]
MKVIKHTAGFFVLAGIGLVFLAEEPASAQNFGPYLKASGGMNLVSDSDLQINAVDGRMSLDTGYRVDGTLGYELNRWLAVEVEGGYTENNLDKVTLGANQLRLHGDSSFSQIPVLANVVLRYENDSAFVPYVGAGAGGVMTKLRIASESADDSDKDTVFAWQGKVGVIYKIDERAWIDAEYKLLSTAAQDYSFGNQKLETKELFNHFIGISVIWKF